MQLKVSVTRNDSLYAEYKKLADAEEKVIFGGRLGEYKYYDMDAVIASALDMCEKGKPSNMSTGYQKSPHFSGD